MWKMIFACFFLFAGKTVLANENPVLPLTEKFLSSPVSHTIVLSGTFSELRNSRFHGGIDIKSKNGIEGDPIYAAADGYISHLQSRGQGYGNLIVITHYNGYLTYYSHLKGFRENLASHILERQKKDRISEISIDINEDLFPVKRGDIIGYMGNTGHSFGPHLHFELREKESGRQLNPLHYGIEITDVIPPLIRGLKQHVLNERLEIHESKAIPVLKAGKNYKSATDTVLVDGVQVGFAIDAIDQMAYNHNKNGIYGMRLFVDDSLYHHYYFDEIPLGGLDYIKAHIDFRERYSSGKSYHLCYRSSGNILPIYYSDNYNYGIIELKNKKARAVRIEVFDFHMNTSTVSFFIKRTDKIKPPKNIDYSYVLPCGERSIVEGNGVRFDFGTHSFCQNAYLSYNESNDKSKNICSKVFEIGNGATPVYTPFKLSIDATLIPQTLRSKAYIAYCESGSWTQNIGGKWEGDSLTANFDKLGKFMIKMDTVKPYVQVLNFNPKVSSKTLWKFKISDNVYHREGLAFDAYLDDEWIPLIYDRKNDLIYYQFNEHSPKDKKKFILVVRDPLQNETIFERTIM